MRHLIELLQVLGARKTNKKVTRWHVYICGTCLSPDRKRKRRRRPIDDPGIGHQSVLIPPPPTDSWHDARVIEARALTLRGGAASLLPASFSFFKTTVFLGVKRDHRTFFSGTTVGLDIIELEWNFKTLWSLRLTNDSFNLRFLGHLSVSKKCNFFLRCKLKNMVFETFPNVVKAIFNKI